MPPLSEEVHHPLEDHQHPRPDGTGDEPRSLTHHAGVSDGLSHKLRRLDSRAHLVGDPRVEAAVIFRVSQALRRLAFSLLGVLRRVVSPGLLRLGDELSDGLEGRLHLSLKPYDAFAVRFVGHG